ncbi:MAG: cysteine desulfurase [Bacilli bacterium]|nr:cysteine desulfurase [Bacilli bacterium]
MNREDFEVLSNNCYLDSAATALKPKCVISKISEYYSDYPANIHRGEYDIAERAESEYNKAREIVASFLGARNDEIVFTSGTTDSLNMVINGYFKNILNKGDEVILTEAEHASLILPWFNLVNELGIVIKYIKLDDNYHVTIDNLKDVITDKTKVISLAQITNVLGDIRPIKDICALAHEKGIKVLVDGAQSVPHIKVDVKDLDVDFLAFSGHKICGPTGIGVLYGKKELLNEIKPTRLGGGMNVSFDTPNEIVLKELPLRLEAGTPNIAGAIGLGEAINYINNIGIDNIYKHECELKEYFLDKVKDIPYIHVYNKVVDSGIIAINIDDIFAQDVGYYLNKYKICVRTGNHCAKLLKNVIGTDHTIRISLYLYNNKEDIDKVVKLLSDKERIMKEMLV